MNALTAQSGLQGDQTMHLGKGQIIIVLLACFVADIALARPQHRTCEALRGHGAYSCHCDSKYDDSRRSRRRLLAGFETEYDVEKWEKAYRQGHAQWGSPSKQRRCGVGSYTAPPSPAALCLRYSPPKPRFNRDSDRPHVGSTTPQSVPILAADCKGPGRFSWPSTRVTEKPMAR